MPGTFLDEAEERAFVARLDQSPPQMVLWPPGDFDQIPERGIERAAPHLVAWVRERFERSGAGPFYHLLVPRSAGDDGVDPGSGEADDEG